MREQNDQLSKTAQSCHLSVLRMNQTDELAMKRVFGVMTLLKTDYLIFLQVYQLSLQLQVYFSSLLFFYRSDSIFLQDTSLLLPWFIQMSPLLKAIL